MSIKITPISLRHCILPNLIHKPRVRNLIIKSIRPKNNKIMRTTDLESFDLWLRNNDIGIPVYFLEFCMCIPNSSTHGESSWDNSMRTTDFTPVFYDFESVGVIVVSLLWKVMLKRLIGQNFINLLQNHLSTWTFDLFDCTDIHIAPSSFNSLHFIRISRLVISRKNKKILSSIGTKQCSWISNINDEAIIIDNQTSNHAWPCSQKLLIWRVLVISIHHVIINLLNSVSDDLFCVRKEVWVLQKQVMKVIHQVLRTVASSMSIINGKEINSRFWAIMICWNGSLIRNNSVFIIRSHWPFITEHSIRNNNPVWVWGTAVWGVGSLRDTSTIKTFKLLSSIWDWNLVFQYSLGWIRYFSPLSHKRNAALRLTVLAIKLRWFFDEHSLRCVILSLSKWTALLIYRLLSWWFWRWRVFQTSFWF